MGPELEPRQLTLGMSTLTFFHFHFPGHVANQRRNLVIHKINIKGNNYTKCMNRSFLL